MNEQKKQDILQQLRTAQAAEELGEQFESLRVLMKYGEQLAPFPDDRRTQENLVTKCLSTVYFIGSLEDGMVKYFADSDSAFVRGEIYILLHLFNNSSPEEIVSEAAQQEFYDFFDELRQYVSISMNRQQGFEGMYERMCEIAEQYMDDPDDYL